MSDNPHASHIREAAEAYAQKVYEQTPGFPSDKEWPALKANQAFLAGAKAALASPVVKAMAEALMFYSAQVKYHTHWKNGHGLPARPPEFTSQIDNDSGHRAAKALAALESAKGEG